MSLVPVVLFVLWCCLLLWGPRAQTTPQSRSVPHKCHTSVALRGSVVLFVRSCAHVCAGVCPELRAWLFLCCPEAYRP